MIRFRHLGAQDASGTQKMVAQMINSKAQAGDFFTLIDSYGGDLCSSFAKQRSIDIPKPSDMSSREYFEAWHRNCSDDLSVSRYVSVHKYTHFDKKQYEYFQFVPPALLLSHALKILNDDKPSYLEDAKKVLIEMKKDYSWLFNKKCEEEFVPTYAEFLRSYRDLFPNWPRLSVEGWAMMNHINELINNKMIPKSCDFERIRPY